MISNTAPRMNSQSSRTNLPSFPGRITGVGLLFKICAKGREPKIFFFEPA
jgi:hypothetical protein